MNPNPNPHTAISGTPLADLWEPSAAEAAERLGWSRLCDEVDTLVYVTEYLPAGGTRTFEQWRRGEWPPEHSRRHPLKSYDPAWHVRPLARFDGMEGA